MKLVSMQMRNWRSFYGDNALEFSTDPDKPVTLILGSNGAGKTALLNAFTWVIYGEFTEGFDRHTDLINHEALNLDPHDDAQVELHLVHDGREYRIRRTVTAPQQAAGTNAVFVSVDGTTETEEAIHQLLPKALKDLFFFPAETFGTAKILRSQTKRDGTPSLRIDEAIRTLLAGDVYENAVRDLRSAVNSPALKPSKGNSDDALARASSDYEQAQALLDSAEREHEELPDMLAFAKSEADKAEHAAHQFDPEKIREFNEELTLKAKAVEHARLDALNATSLYVELARHAHGHFAIKGIRAAVARLDTAEACGMIPPRIDGQVLDHSLEHGRCALCGEPLSDAGRSRVEDLRQRVADSTTALRGLEARSQLKGYLVRSQESLNQLRARVTEFAAAFESVSSPAADADLTHLRATIGECIALADRYEKRATTALKDFQDHHAPDPAAGNLVQVAIARKLKVVEIEDRLERNATNLIDLKAKRDAAFSTLAAKSKGSQESTNRIAAINLLEEAKAFFETASTGLTGFGRLDFERAINQTFTDLVRKPYELRVDSEFRIELYSQGTEQQVAASQAENVLLLIAFLGAIARLAPVYQQIARDRAQFTAVGGVETSGAHGFPVVIDAPTSALDDQYEEEVVKALPRLLPQVIIPVSAKSVTNWEKISDKVGRVYIMELTSKGQDNRKIRWGGKDRVYSTSDDSVMTRTRIVSAD